MLAAEKERKIKTVRIELIDNWHRDWPSVLRQIDRHGGRGKLQVDPDDWLSARQCLLVALRGDEELVGHLVFHLRPVVSGSNGRRPLVDAHLDDVSVRTGLGQAKVRDLLIDAAMKHAQSLRVRRLVDFA